MKKDYKKKKEVGFWVEVGFIHNLDLACELTDRTRTNFIKRALKREMIEVFKLNGVEFKEGERC